MQELEHAARALGWDGHVVPDLEAFGVRFAAIARIRPEVHEWRRTNGWGPALNPDWFHRSDANHHHQLPVAAVDLLGTLVPSQRAEDAAHTCGALLSLAPCSVVLPWRHPYLTWPMMELDYYGIGVLHVANNGPAALMLEPQNRAAEFGPSMFARWLLEVLYSKLLQRPRLAENA